MKTPASALHALKTLPKMVDGERLQAKIDADDILRKLKSL
jgi:hypothetical protein